MKHTAKRPSKRKDEHALYVIIVVPFAAAAIPAERCRVDIGVPSVPILNAGVTVASADSFGSTSFSTFAQLANE